MASRLLSRFGTLANAANKNSVKAIAPLTTQSKQHLSAITKILSNNSAAKTFNLSSIALATAVPAYAFLPPVAVFIDPLVAVALPVHMYIGCGYVIDDYVPVGLKGPARLLWFIVCLFASWGLLKISLTYGLGNVVKSLWYPAGTITNNSKDTKQSFENFQQYMKEKNPQF